MSKYPIVDGAAVFPEGITEIPARAFYIDKELRRWCFLQMQVAFTADSPSGVTYIGQQNEVLNS